MSLVISSGVVLAKDFTWNETIWNPSMLGPTLWLDAADASTVTLNGSTVSRWNNKSGNNISLVQPITENQPTYSLASLNGLNTLSFDGSNDTMATVANVLPTGNSPRSMFVVYRPLREVLENSVAGQSLSGSASTWFMLQFRASAGAGDPYFAGYSNDLSTGILPTLTPKIGGVTHDGATTTLYGNGAQVAQGAKTLVTNTGIFRVGSSIGSSEFAQMLLAEVVFVSRSLATLERQKLEGYLAHKWGLEADLPANHPYKTVGPTP